VFAPLEFFVNGKQPKPKQKECTMNSESAVPSSVPAVDTTPPYPEMWMVRVGAFASAVGKSVVEVTTALKSVVGEPGEEALGILSDSTSAPDADLRSALAELKIPSGKFNMHLPKLRGAPKATESSAGAPSSTPMQALAILPTVPDDTSFVEMLKTGGVLEVGPTEVLSAVKAGLARRIGLFELPDRILEKMEAFADVQAKPCGEAFFKMQQLLTQRRYGDVLTALGVPGSFVSERRKRDFFERLDAKLWIALEGFQGQLTAWQQAWMSGAANPGMLMLAMATNHAGAPMPPGMMAPPDTMPLRAAGDAVVDEINRVFAGPGIPVARALAYDATRIMGILGDSSLPAQMGVATREQMLKDLGVNVGTDIIQIERSLTRYTLAIISLKDVAADAELAYLAAMLQLGATVPWDKLTSSPASGGRAGIGRSAPRRGSEEEL
jgi:hypothetical protein